MDKVTEPEINDIEKEIIDKSDILEEISKPEIVPSIIIGLGGTGQDIVCAVKKRITDEFGELPIFKYLVLDTDHKKEDSILNNSEFIQLKVDDPDGYIRGIDNYPELKEWWPNDLHRIGKIDTGAKQKRPIGRFALFMNITDIRNILYSRINDVRQRNSIDETERKGFTVRDDFKVFIVNSLGGGTGSGMFLDIAFNIHALGNINNISGYTILPNVFDIDEKNRSSVAANTYAALKELDYYMDINAGHFFKCGYDERTQVEVHKKPFDMCYIVDSISESTSIKYNDAIQSIANSIYLDLASNIGFNKEAAQSNFDTDLESYLDTENKKYLNAYASLGLYSFYYPGHEIRKTCIYRYAKQLLDEIIKPIDGIDDLIESIKRDMTVNSKIKFEINSLKNILSNDKFNIPSKIEDVKIDNIKDDEIVEKLGSWFNNELKIIENTISVTIHNNKKESLETIKAHLYKEIEEIVEDDAKGLAVGYAIIDSLVSFINAHLYILSSEDGNNGKIAKSKSELSKLNEEGKENLEDLENKISSKFVLFKSDVIKRRKKAFLECSVNYLDKSVDILKEKEIKTLYIEVIKILSDIRSDLDNIERKLKQIRGSFSESEESMIHKIVDEISYFQLEVWVGGSKERINLAYKEFEVSPKKGKQSVCQNLLYNWKDWNTKMISDRILNFSEKQYKDIKIDIGDVFTDSNGVFDSKVIEKILKRTEVQITYSGTERFKRSKIKEINIIGVPPKLKNKIERIVRKTSKNPDLINVVATKDRMRISNVKYKYIIPLMGMKPVENMKLDYDCVINNRERPLHTQKIDFEEIT